MLCSQPACGEGRITRARDGLCSSPLLFSLPSWAVALLSPLSLVRTWFGLILWLSTKSKQNKNQNQWLLRILSMAFPSFIQGAMVLTVLSDISKVFPYNSIGCS